MILINEGVKYPCGECDFKATTKENVAEHQRPVHEGVKYPCTKWGKQFSSKG